MKDLLIKVTHEEYGLIRAALDAPEPANDALKDLMRTRPAWEPVRLFLDTEFNEFGGELISMALVSETGHEWYEVRQISEVPGDWVSVNVLPKLEKAPITDVDFINSLGVFLRQFPEVEIIADWPADFEYFTALLARAWLHSGYQLRPQDMTMRLIKSSDPSPDNPHNALSDARALRDWYLEHEDEANA